MQLATRRRLDDELNIQTELEFIYKFFYRARFADIGSENELCHVYLGKISNTVHANEQEISGIRFVSATKLADELSAMPEQFTPWFKMEWQALLDKYRDALARYCDLSEQAG